MRIEYDAAEALKISSANAQRAWMGGQPGQSAKDRLNAGGPLDIQHKPKFLLDASWPVFTIGSCFAREIENVLIQKGLSVLLKGHGIENQYLASWDRAKDRDDPARTTLNRGPMNKYTVHSMAHEIRTALRGETYPNQGLIQLNDELWNDPHSAGLKNADYDTTLAHRRRIAASTAEIRNARVVFITLGLTETWIHKPTGMPMNVHPGSDWLVRLKNQLAFVDYGFSEALDALVSTIELIRQTCHPDMRFIVTVSPVPFGATFKNQDVVVANSGSKATLRAVAEELYRRFDYVDYYPSYELAAYSPRSFVYTDDQAHIQPSFVRFITSKFLTSYYPDLAAAAA